MSIKIHHGPPGSYKTSGAVMDDLIPALLKGITYIEVPDSFLDQETYARRDRENQPGHCWIRFNKKAEAQFPDAAKKTLARPIVTNVRGISLERIYETLPDALPDIELITVDTSKADGRDRLSKWFHWVPHGAFILIDEAQMIWPKSWRETQLAQLNYPANDDYPNYVDAASAVNRPAHFVDAFDMHRHYNWDIVLSTPDIRKIRDDVRGAAEGAYRHKNLALLGSLFKGRYMEGFHMAADSGQSASDYLTVTQRKIKKEVWGLYDSTATGDISDTKAGRSIFKNPKIIFLLGVLAVCLGTVFYTGGISIFRDQPVKTAARPAPTGTPFHNDEGVAAPVDDVPVRVGHIEGHSPVVVTRDPLGAMQLAIVGQMEATKNGITRYITYFAGTGDDSAVSPLNSDQISEMGYSVTIISDCIARLRWEQYGVDRYVYCPGAERRVNTLRVGAGVERGEQQNGGGV
ncbi:zonular occludens toxin domain-containing protein [Chitiniphilus eburneus]|uniref:zonular occludens toxin domain-containing protein n=1 Tax=Chitiniphilus eburneus TaxID=2571148 RepID=UPI0035CF6255